jgi:hypothetical protein
MNRRGDKHHSREMAGATVGSWAGQGAYQAAGYGAKHHGLRNLEPKTTKAQRNKHLKPVKAKYGAYTPAMERNYPKHLPEASVHRTLGWTHRGKVGTAVGTAATAAGGAAGLHHARSKSTLGKALYQQERRTSPVRTLQTGAGLALAGWGLGHSGMLGAALARGVKAANQAGHDRALYALKTAQVAQGSLRRGTAPGERALRRIRAVDQAVRAVPAPLRPEIAAASGILLAARAQPMQNTSYRPVSTTYRVRSY